MDILIAREAIVADLQRRLKEADPKVKRIDRGRNYVVQGSGFVACPVCNKGRLNYSCATNGHVMAKCSTETCVRWME